MAALGKRGWERARLSFPYLELARRAWLNNTVAGVRGRGRVRVRTRTRAKVRVRVGVNPNPNPSPKTTQG